MDIEELMPRKVVLTGMSDARLTPGSSS